MADAVSPVLDRRREEIGQRRLGPAATLAVLLHFALIAAAVVLPRLLAPVPEPPSYVAVQIVPAARLGIEEPKPRPRRPEPKKPEPVPKPEPKTEAPVLPEPNARKPQPERPRPAPAEAAPEAPTAPDASEDDQTQGSPTGSESGLSLGAAVAGFDNPNFTYGYYVDQMLAKISSNWSRPPVGSGIETVLHFRIARDGRVTDLRITNSSGINSFDLAALRAVQASSPLPPLPRAFREDSLGVNLIVR